MSAEPLCMPGLVGLDHDADSDRALDRSLAADRMAALEGEGDRETGFISTLLVGGSSSACVGICSTWWLRYLVLTLEGRVEGQDPDFWFPCGSMYEPSGMMSIIFSMVAAARSILSLRIMERSTLVRFGEASCVTHVSLGLTRRLPLPESTKLVPFT